MCGFCVVCVSDGGKDNKTTERDTRTQKVNTAGARDKRQETETLRQKANAAGVRHTSKTQRHSIKSPTT